MDIYRVTARWSGFPGAPGYSAFHFASGFLDGGLLGDEAESLALRVRSAFDSLSSRLPDSVSVQVEPTVEVIDSDTGMIQSFEEVDAGSAVSGGTGQNFAGPVGGVINWRTNDVRNGRRIRGRTFIVPLASGAYEEDGTLEFAYRSDLQDFADVMRGGVGEGDLGVWSRPVNGSGGVFATVTSASVPDMAAVLRSRRD